MSATYKYHSRFNSTEKSHSWESNSRLTDQEIPYFVWNPKIHYCVHDIVPLNPFMRQISPIYILTTYLFQYQIIFELC